MNLTPTNLTRGAILGLTFGGILSLHASDPATDARLRALQHELNTLRAELAAEKASRAMPTDYVAGEDVLPAEALIDPLDSDEVFVTPKQSPVTELKLRGRMQYQFGYSDADDYSDFSTFEWRRVRLGIDGKLLDNWSFHLMANLLPDAGSTDLDSSYLRYNGLDWTTISFEKLRPRFGAELNTSSSQIKTVERSLLSNTFDPGKITGMSLASDFGLFDVQIGAYNGEIGDQRSSERTFNGKGGVPEYLLNASAGLDLAEVVGLDTAAIRVDYIDNNDDDGINQPFAAPKDAWAASLSLGAGPFSFVAEYIDGDLHNGGEISGFYLMPSVMFSDKLEGVLRYERIEGDDGGTLRYQSRYARRVVASDPGVPGAGSVRGEEYWSLYGGLNYYINKSVKLMFGVEYAELDDILSEGDSLDTLTAFSAVRLEF